MRLANQYREEEFRAAADVVIENGADRDRTKERVRAEWSRLRA
jgi:dephospho-CoA kinase